MGQGNTGLRDIVDIAVATIIILCAIIGAYVLILWANDVRGDRKHSVVVNSPICRAHFHARRKCRQRACSYSQRLSAMPGGLRLR